MNNKTAGHTPEKWEVRMIGKEVTVAVVGSEKIIAFVETEENARLIAAAPELLCALKDAEFLLRKAGQVKGPMQDSFNRSAHDARVTIARAEGR